MNFPSRVLNNVYQYRPHPPGDFVFEALKTSDNSFEMIVNAGVNSVENFDYTVPSNKIAAIHRISFALQDGGMSMEDFGGRSVLPNGVRIVATDSSEVETIDFTNSLAITTNNQFALLAGTDVIVIASPGEDSMIIRWSIFKAGGSLELQAGEKFRVVVQDSLAAITSFRGMVQGVIYNA